MEVIGRLSAGDVVARTGRAFLVVMAEHDVVTLVAIGRALVAQHRADVRLDRWTDNTRPLLTDLVLRCGPLLRCQTAEVDRIGHLPAHILREALLAISRERDTRLVENENGPGSALVALTASAGRRVGVVRYA